MDVSDGGTRYKAVKHEWGQAQYLHVGSAAARSQMTNMHVGTAPLRAVRHRIDDEIDPVCACCDMNVGSSTCYV